LRGGVMWLTISLREYAVRFLMRNSREISRYNFIFNNKYIHCILKCILSKCMRFSMVVSYCNKHCILKEDSWMVQKCNINLI
jgi:hypothetical protein